MVEQRRVTRVTSDSGSSPASTSVSETIERRPSSAEIIRRLIVFVFGVLQALILLRIVLLLLDASRGNELVRFVFDASRLFVSPFEGVLHTNAIAAGASVFDVAALVALAGWSILEAVLLAGVAIARREP